MPIPATERQLVLNDQGCDPQVVGWNWRTLLSQLAVKIGIKLDGRSRGVENVYSGLVEKDVEYGLIFNSTPVNGEARP